MNEKEITQNYSNLCVQIGHVHTQIQKITDDILQLEEVKDQLLEQMDKLCNQSKDALRNIEKISLSKKSESL